MRLLDFERAERGSRSRCTDLVPLEREACTSCGGPVHREEMAEYALVRHGGYGGTRTTRYDVCETEPCMAVRVVQVVETSEGTRRRRPHPPSC
jgi:hypothetical protein